MRAGYFGILVLDQIPMLQPCGKAEDEMSLGACEVPREYLVPRPSFLLGGSRRSHVGSTAGLTRSTLGKVPEYLYFL